MGRATLQQYSIVDNPFKVTFTPKQGTTQKYTVLTLAGSARLTCHRRILTPDVERPLSINDWEIVSHKLHPNPSCGNLQDTLLKPVRDDPGARSPRERYLRKRAAVCIQRHARGYPVRRLFAELTWAVLHFHGAGDPVR